MSSPDSLATLYGEFKQVEANYVAPGDWGRLGILRNPANIRGFSFGASFDVTDRLVVSGHLDTLSGLSTDDATTNPVEPFDNGTSIGSYAVRLDYKVHPDLSLYGSFERTYFSDLAPDTFGLRSGNTGTAEYRFATLGIAYGLSSSAKLNLGYQYSDVKNEAFLAGGTADGRYKGGLLTTQLTVKF